MPHLVRIRVYPVKALDGLDVSEAVVLPGGALEHDRRFALVDRDGFVVNGKRTPAVHPIRSSYDPEARTLTVNLEGQEHRQAFHIDADRGALETWVSGALGVAVTLAEDPASGFPDDTYSPGPTVIAEATLGAVASWFPGLDAGDCLRRFRPNLVVAGTEPFWDDRLYSGGGRVVRFRVGGVVLDGVNPCQRCVVPGRSPTTGHPIPGFQKHFSDRRRETLSEWAEPTRFDHFFRLAVNTRLSDRGPGTVRVGDEVEQLGTFAR